MVKRTAADFIGTWRLLDYSFLHDDGRVEKPWGDDVRGYIVYTAQGYMSANLSPAIHWTARRARLAAKLSMNPGEERLRERNRRRDYIAYSGSFSVEDEKVIHHVEVSLYPNWVGRPEVRFYSFEENNLTLRTGPIRSGRHTVVAQLVWERVS
ncbi:lipocalin-like domain-containing protein [Silvibacterium acidisoli]|uniref:lipocalin-like domain-containing protein n=1 Tax=Acidobacteriaceae bacterium ZG23-2 TaxID=2883246 RepID=UPI00406C6504